MLLSSLTVSKDRVSECTSVQSQEENTSQRRLGEEAEMACLSVWRVCVARHVLETGGEAELRVSVSPAGEERGALSVSESLGSAQSSLQRAGG